MKKWVSISVAAVALGATVGFGSVDPIDAYVEARRKSSGVPGISIAIVRNGKVEKAKGYGLADVEHNVPATEHTVYQFASVTKQFTAEAIMLLAHQGKLRLDDSIAKFYTNAPAAWGDVTVRHLLSHTSGIQSFTELPDFFDNIRNDYTTDELIGRIRSLPLHFQPGERWRYSNSGYHLLGLIIETVSGESYGDFLAARIFRPLGMSTARANHNFEIIPNRATGYITDRGRLRRAEFVSHTQPFAAGGLIGTVLDLAKWDAALYTDRILPASVHEQMWTAATLADGKPASHGFGWRVGKLRGHRYVTHSGLNAGFTSCILRLLDDRFTAIVLCNGPGSPEALAIGIAKRCVPGLSLASVEPQPDPDPELTKRLEQCLAELAERKDSALLTPEFSRNFRGSRRRHSSIVEDLKTTKAFVFVAREEAAEPGAARFNALYRLTTAAGPRFYSFALTPENKIAGLDIEE